MVERKESSGLEEFQATVREVQKEEGTNGPQYHFFLTPEDVKIQGKTGELHEWIPLSKTSSEDAIAKGSVLDGFLRQLELCMPEAKKAATISDAFALMIGRRFQFQRLELGRAYEGNPARQYSVPTKLIE